MFKKIRLTILLLLLAAVALDSWLDKSRARDWDRTLRVVLYPINGDDSEAASRHIASLRRDDFLPIEDFFRHQGQAHGLALRTPVDVQLADEIASRPPPLPREAGTLSIMGWSLKMRYWAFRVDEYDGPTPEVRLFLLYFDPRQNGRLPHSVGMEKGLLGIVNVFAGRRHRGRNNVVITHELLHTVGARDKYDPRTNLPLFPLGYAAPQRTPLYPQTRAEIMGGRIPMSEQRAVIPGSLELTVIGPATAREIGWPVNSGETALND